MVNAENMGLAEKSKSFCILPWVHLHALPDGEARLCCLATAKEVHGNLATHTIAEILNSEPHKEARRRMLRDEPVSACEACHIAERAEKCTSSRIEANNKFKEYFSVVNETLPDGALPEPHVVSLDIRFTNGCNFRCRTCHPDFSSSWTRDYAFLNPGFKKKQHLSLDLKNKNFWPDLAQLIPNLKEIYFAGGEPLLMREHYRILEMLVEQGKDNINIIYSTNLSNLRLGSLRVIDLWKKLKNVKINLSADASGERGELIRKGAIGEEILKNFQEIREQCPHVDIGVSATVSALNVFAVVGLHRRITGMSESSGKNFAIYMVQGPAHYNPQLLPLSVKQKAVNLYKEHIEYLTEKDAGSGIYQKAIRYFSAAINYLLEQNLPEQLPRFLRETRMLDILRSEDSHAVFGELSQVWDFENQHFDELYGNALLLLHPRLAKLPADLDTKKYMLERLVFWHEQAAKIEHLGAERVCDIFLAEMEVDTHPSTTRDYLFNKLWDLSKEDKLHRKKLASAKVAKSLAFAENRQLIKTLQFGAKAVSFYKPRGGITRDYALVFSRLSLKQNEREAIYKFLINQDETFPDELHHWLPSPFIVQIFCRLKIDLESADEKSRNMLLRALRPKSALDDDVYYQQFSNIRVSEIKAM